MTDRSQPAENTRVPARRARGPVSLGVAAGACVVAAVFGLSGCRDTPTRTGEADAIAPDPGARGDSLPRAGWGEVRRVVASRCVTCHAEPGPAADLDLTVGANVQREALTGTLLARINDAESPMPPGGLLPQMVRDAIAGWARDGAPIRPGDRAGVWTPGWGETPGGSGSAGDRDMPEHREPVPAFDIDARGFEFLERMQGHWVGSMELMGQPMPWFAFDYRAIGPAHVHGIFEGGTAGNLMTSFFHARVRGVETLVARNGGVLNGIYRMSYFVLDRIEERGDATEYRFVDAIGGPEIMWMTLLFEGDRLSWKSYTSRMGEQPEPTRHMDFTARRRPAALADNAAAAVGFPERGPVLELPDGFAPPDWGGYGPVTSASYMWQDPAMDVGRMGALSGDPLRIEHLTHLARLELRVDRTRRIGESRLLVYLSEQALTDADGSLRTRWGRIDEAAFDSVLQFPEITGDRNRFEFTHLHPGDYVLTVVADRDGDGLPSDADAVSPSRPIRVEPGGRHRVRIDDFVE